MKWVIRLYPRAWRERYGAELETLLEDSGFSWGAIPGMLLEALRMQLQLGSWRVIAAVGLAGFLIAWGVSFRLPEHFISTATVVLDPPTGLDAYAARDAAKVLTEVAVSRISHPMLVREPGLESKSAVIPGVKREDVGITMSQQTDGKVVAELRYRGESPMLARAAVQRLLTQLTSMHKENQRDLETAWRASLIDEWTAKREALGSRLTVLDPPTLVPDPVSPNRLTVAITGFLAALFGLASVGVIAHFQRASLGLGLVILLGGVVMRHTDLLPVPSTSTAVMLFDSAQTRQTAMDLAGPGIQVLPDSWSRRLTLVARDTDPPRAQRTLQLAITRMIAANVNRRRALNLHTNLGGPTIEVLDVPSLPIARYNQFFDAMAGTGLVLAITAGIILSVRRRTAADAVPNPA